MAKPLKSVNVSTNNILLKVTVPKRIGLKRRRGVDRETEVLRDRAAPMIKDAQYLFRSLYENSRSYQVEAIGTVNQTHRFRGTWKNSYALDACTLNCSGMPGFVTSTENMPLIQKFRKHILPFECKTSSST